MRSYLCNYIVRIFHISDAVNLNKCPLFSSQYVCKRRFSSTDDMAQGGSIKENSFLVVGLGNLDMPKTRHSVGMQMTDILAQRFDARFKRNKECQSMVASVEVNGATVILVKPKLPMNINGRCVSKAVRHYGIQKENIILIHDNLDQKLGKATLKEKGGSHGGHNGIKSVAASIPSGKTIARISIGIDRPASSSQEDIVDYVLSAFTRNEQDIVEETLEKAIQILEEYISKRTNNSAPAKFDALDGNNNVID